MAFYVIRVPQAGVLPQATFQIPPHDGHPCLKLMVATANPIAYFHCQAIIHAGRTRYPRLYRRGTLKIQALFVLYLPFLAF